MKPPKALYNPFKPTVTLWNLLNHLEMPLKSSWNSLDSYTHILKVANMRILENNPAKLVLVRNLDGVRRRDVEHANGKGGLTKLFVSKSSSALLRFWYPSKCSRVKIIVYNNSLEVPCGDLKSLDLQKQILDLVWKNMTFLGTTGKKRVLLKHLNNLCS